MKKTKEPEYGISQGGKVIKRIFTLRDVDGFLHDIPEHEVARAMCELMELTRSKTSSKEKPVKKSKKEKLVDSFAP